MVSIDNMDKKVNQNVMKLSRMTFSDEVMEVRTIIELIDEGKLAIPDFQRGYVTEDDVRFQSYLIVTMMLNILRVPPIRLYRNYKNDSMANVSDGQQRVFTLYYFAKGNIRLNLIGYPVDMVEVDGEVVSIMAFHGRTFEELPFKFQKDFMRAKLRTDITNNCPNNFPELEFKLLNCGVTLLKPQEIRMASMAYDMRESFRKIVRDNKVFTNLKTNKQQRRSNIDADIVCNVLMLIFSKGPCRLTSKVVDGFINQFKTSPIPDELMDKLVNAFGFMDKVGKYILKNKAPGIANVSSFNKKVNADIISIFTKSNFTLLTYLASVAIEDDVTVEEFAKFILIFFANPPQEYKDKSKFNLDGFPGIKVRLGWLTREYERILRPNIEESEQLAQ